MESILFYKNQVKISEEKAKTYLELFKSIDGGEQLFEIIPDLLDRHYKEVKDNEEKYNKTIDKLKENHENKIKEIEAERDLYKWRQVEEFLSDEDYYGSTDEEI
jgi:hypothetical protein